MRRFAAAAVLLALLLAAYADAACTGIPNGPTNSNWPRTGPGACPGTAAGQNCTGSCNSGELTSLLGPYVFARCVLGFTCDLD